MFVNFAKHRCRSIESIVAMLTMVLVSIGAESDGPVPRRSVSIVHRCRDVGEMQQLAILFLSSPVDVRILCERFRAHRSLLASRSDSSRVRRSPSRTGPLTFLMI